MQNKWTSVLIYLISSPSFFKIQLMNWRVMVHACRQSMLAQCYTFWRKHSTVFTWTRRKYLLWWRILVAPAEATPYSSSTSSSNISSSVTRHPDTRIYPSSLLSSPTFLPMTSTLSSSSSRRWPTRMSVAWKSVLPPRATALSLLPVSLAPSTAGCFPQNQLMFSTRRFPCIGSLRFVNI